MKDRIRNKFAAQKIMTADEAARLINDGMVVGVSGFTMASYPKAVPLALAERAQQGEELGLTIISGASVGDELDGALARAGVVKRRYPYQTNESMRGLVNEGKISYVDMHLSQVPYWIKYGYFGKIDVAIIEAVAIDEAGNIIPPTSVGCTNVLVEYADRVIVEINTAQPPELEGIHDIYSTKPLPNTEPIPVVAVNDRVGTPFIPCPPEKIAAIVMNDIPDKTLLVSEPDEISQVMAQHLIGFLEAEIKVGRLPAKLPPLQSGTGSVANAILSGLSNSDFRGISLFSEVLQESVFDLIDSGTVAFASGTSLSIPPSKAERIRGKLPEYKEKIILRPTEISNSPEVIRRLGVIAVNTALEVDLSGNVNSTHVQGTRVMNGIGGSGDFARNAALSIFTTTSTAKKGAISCIVPRVSHVDHTEHDIHIIITEQGVADLRGLTAYERAEALIENCAHPDFRPELRKFISECWDSNTHKHGIPAY